MLGRGRCDVYLPGCGLHGPLYSRWILIELVFVLTGNLVVVRHQANMMITSTEVAFICLIKFVVECIAVTSSVYKRFGCLIETRLKSHFLLLTFLHIYIHHPLFFVTFVPEHSELFFFHTPRKSGQARFSRKEVFSPNLRIKRVRLSLSSTSINSS